MLSRAYRGGYSHQSLNTAAIRTITPGSHWLYSRTSSSPARLLRAYGMSASGGVSSVTVTPNGQAAWELAKTKRFAPTSRARSSRLRVPWTLVRTYSKCSSLVKS